MDGGVGTDARTILEEVDVEYLACPVGTVPATKPACLSGGQLSHDQITRTLSGPADSARELWAKVKPLGRAVEKEAVGKGVLIIDDTILAKPHGDERAGWRWPATLSLEAASLVFVSTRAEPTGSGARATAARPEADAALDKPRATAAATRPLYRGKTDSLPWTVSTP